jgi:hypothetical protein
MNHKRNQQRNREVQWERRMQDFVGQDQGDGTGNSYDSWDQSSYKMEEAIRYLGETRERGNITREAYLETLIDRLKHSYCYDFLQTQKEELVRILLLALDSESESELINCCSVISLLFVHFGTEWKDAFKKFEPLLKRNVTNCESYNAKTANLETLCWCWFLISEESGIKSHEEYLENFINEKSFSITKESAWFFQSCLDMWCLLLTKLDKSLVVDEYLDSLITIVQLLTSDYDIYVRLAAGEALALVVSIVSMIEAENERDYSKFYFNGYFNVLQVIEALQTTDEVQNRKISKKDREKQRYTFKEVLSTLETGTSPITELSINGKKYTFSTWVEIKRLEILRAILGSGFLIHLQYNPLVSEQLDIKVDSSDKTVLSKADKQLKQALTSFEEKERTLLLHKGRSDKIKRTSRNISEEE